MRRCSTPEGNVQKAVLDLLAAERIWAMRINTGKVRTVDGRYFQAHTAGKGTADILATPDARQMIRIPNTARYETVYVPCLLWIETKAPRKGQSLEQMWFQRDMEDRNHYYLIARSVEDVLNWLKQFSKSR